MSVKYSWNRQNGAAMPSVRFMSIEPAEDYYKGMPLKLKEKGVVEPTDGDPEYICMAEYNPDAEIQPLEIPVQEVFPDVVYDRMNEDGTIEEVRFGSKGGGGGGDLLETVETEVPLVITWDGDLTGKEFVNGFVKVSNDIISAEMLLGSIAIAVDSSGQPVLEIEGTAENIADETSQGTPAVLLGYEGTQLVVCVQDDISGDDGGFAFTAGVWFMYMGEDGYINSLTCPNATTTTTKQQLKPSLLPNHKHKWDDIEDAICWDRSVSEPLNITFDGDLTNYESLDVGDGQHFVKMSDAILTVDDLVGGTVIYVEGEQEKQLELTNENVVDMSVEASVPAIMVGFEGVMVIYGDMSAMGLPLTPGVWFAYAEGQMLVKSLSTPNVNITTGEIKKIDNKFLDLAWLPTTSKQNVEILPETTLDFANGRLFEISSNLTEQLAAGNKYTVFWNGEKFELNATRVEVFEGEYATYIGNINLLMSGDAEGGYDFVIYLIEAGSMSTWVGVRDGVTTAVAQIMGNVTRYNTIPNDFLPPELSAKPIIFNNHTHQYIQEIANALNAGREVYINDDRLYHVVSAMYDPIDGWDKVLMISAYGIYYIDGWEDGYLDGNNSTGTIRPMLQRTSDGTTNLFMRSSNHKRFKVNVDDSGQLITTEV